MTMAANPAVARNPAVASYPSAHLSPRVRGGSLVIG